MSNYEIHQCLQGQMRAGAQKDCRMCENELFAEPIVKSTGLYRNSEEAQMSYDAVEPPHYQRGPRLNLDRAREAGVVGSDGVFYYNIACIDVFRAMQDPRLATAFKYIWRVAFGGKDEPWDSRDQQQRDTRDIRSAIWYLEDFCNNPVAPLADTHGAEYNALKSKLERLEVEMAQNKAKRPVVYREPKNSGIDLD